MGFGDTFGAGFGGRFGASLGGGGQSPLTIFGAANVPWWVNGDNRVMSGAGVETLTNLANPGVGNPTQATGGNRPTVVMINGKAFIDFESPQELQAVGISPVLYSGAGELTLYISGRTDVLANTPMMEISNGATGFSGLRIGFQASNVFRAYAEADSAAKTSYTDTGVHVYRNNYSDAANLVSLSIDGVVEATAAKTGAISLDGDRVSMGTNAAGGTQLNGAIREAFLFVGTPTAAQEAEATAYLSQEAGI